MWSLYNHSYKVLTSKFYSAWLLDLRGYRKNYFNDTSAVGCEIKKSRDKQSCACETGSGVSFYFFW